MVASGRRRIPEAATAMLAAALVASQFIAGRASRDALFLAHFDVSALPAAVVAAAALSIVLSVASARTLPGVRTAVYAPIAFALSAGLFVVEWLLLAGGHPDAGATALYLHVSGLGPMLGSAFWLFASERFNPRTARALFARMAAAGTVGGLIGAWLASRIAASAGAASVLPALAGLNLAAGWLIWRLARSVPVESETGNQAGALALTTTWSSLIALARVVYLRRLATVVLLGSLAATLVDYVFKADATAYLGQGDALLRFFSLYYAGVNLLVFATQVVSTRVVTQTLGLAGAVASPSAGLFVGCGVGLLWPGLGSVVTARGVESVLRASLFRSAYEVFFTPLPARQKRAAKSLIDVAADRLGEAAGAAIVALVLLGAASHARTTVLVLALCGSLAAAVIARGLAHLYVGALEHRLHDRARELKLSDIHDRMTRTLMLQSLTAAGVLAGTVSGRLSRRSSRRLERSPLDADLLQILALRSGNRTRVLRVLDPANALSARVVAHVVPLLESGAVARAAMRALENVADSRAGELTDALLDQETPVVVRRRVARVLGKARSQRAMDGLVLALDDDRRDVRQQCGRSLLSLRRRAPELTVDSGRIFACAQREVRRLEQLPAEDATTGHVFTLLSLVLPEAPLRVAHRGIENGDRVLRGTALEYLAEVLPADLRDALSALLERPRRAGPGAAHRQGGC